MSRSALTLRFPLLDGRRRQLGSRSDDTHRGAGVKGVQHGGLKLAVCLPAQQTEPFDLGKHSVVAGVLGARGHVRECARSATHRRIVALAIRGRSDTVKT